MLNKVDDALHPEVSNITPRFILLFIKKHKTMLHQDLLCYSSKTVSLKLPNFFH